MKGQTMKTENIATTLLAFLASTAICVAVEPESDAIVIKTGEREWRFVAVEGTSRLPLDYMRTGDGAAKTNLVPVTMPKFWISEKMTTEGEFAALTGRKVRDGRKAEQPLADIEWQDALDYCEKFTAKYSKKLPANTFASMPTMLEWAHAVKVLSGKIDLSGAPGTFLFTLNQFGGVLVTPHTFDTQKKPDFDLAVDLAILPKRARQPFTGLRMVLLSWNGGKVFANKEQIDNSIVVRGSALATYGLWENAKRHLKQALAKGDLSADDRSRAKNALGFSEQEHEHDYEDWSGLVQRAAAFAERFGYSALPYADGWLWLEYEGGKERPGIASEYGRAGIVGEWMKIGDLPEPIKKDQDIGGEDYILIFRDGSEETFEYSYVVTESNLVQVVKCDFNGDGRGDMVVETLSSVGSGGYWYGFYEATENGGFKKIGDGGVQLAGLCAIPRKDGKGCGFIVIDKVSNPVLAASILSVKDGEFVSNPVPGKSIYMLDAKPGKIYMPAPFIGAGYGIGFRHLESRGIWYRPVFWPWKQGEVQGWKDAVKKAQEAWKGTMSPAGTP